MGAIDELGLKPGVIYGDDVLHVPISFTYHNWLIAQLFEYARKHQFAIPAIV